MARNLSEVLSRSIGDHYAATFVAQFPKNAGTTSEHMAIAAEAYSTAQARKIGDPRVSTKVVNLAEKAKEKGIDPDPLLIAAAEWTRNAGKNKIIAAGPTEHIVIILDELIRQKELKASIAAAKEKPWGIYKA